MANPMMAQLMRALQTQQQAAPPVDYSQMSDLELSRRSINDVNAAAAMQQRTRSRSMQGAQAGPGGPLPSTTPGLSLAPTITNQGSAMSMLDRFGEFAEPGQEPIQREGIPADDGGMNDIMSMLAGMKGKFAGPDISGSMGTDTLMSGTGNDMLTGDSGSMGFLNPVPETRSPFDPMSAVPSTAAGPGAGTTANLAIPRGPTLEPPLNPGMGPSDFAAGGPGPPGGAGPQGVFDMMGATPSTASGPRPALEEFKVAMAGGTGNAQSPFDMMGPGPRKAPTGDTGFVPPLAQSTPGGGVENYVPGSAQDLTAVGQVPGQTPFEPGAPPQKPMPPLGGSPAAPMGGAPQATQQAVNEGGFVGSPSLMGPAGGPGSMEQPPAPTAPTAAPKKSFLEGLGLNSKDLLQFGLAMAASSGPEGIRGRSIGESIGMAGLSTTKQARKREDKRYRREAAAEKQRLEREKVQVQKQQHKTESDLKRRQIDTNADVRNLSLAIKADQNVLMNTLKLMAIKQREQAGNVNLGRLAATLASNEATTLFDIEEKVFGSEEQKQALIAQTRAGYDQMRAKFGIPVPGRGGREPPPEAVAKLKANASEEAKKWFDQTFGPGAAKRALGK